MREQDDTLAGKSLLRRRDAYKPLLAVILVAAALGFWWVVYNEDRDLRTQFLEHARMVSRAIDWIDIQELSASEADLASPAYRRIKAQLIGIHNAGPNNRFVYLLRQRPDGVIVILADSEPPSSKEYSPPGQVYQEASPTIRQMFAGGREATVGPYSSRWDRRVSAIAPVSDPEIGRTVALLGMDIAARDWYRELALETAESLSLVLLFIVPLAVYVMQRRRSEQSLQHAGEEWRRTFDTIPDMITIVDSEHRIVRANRATWQKLGCEMQDLLGKPCYSLFHGIDSPPEFCPHAQLLQDGLAHSFEFFEPRLNGYLDVTVTPLRDPDGNMTGSIHIAHDITLRKQAEEALRASEELFRLLFEKSNDAIFNTIPDGVVISANPEACRMFGMTVEEFCRGGRSVVIDPADDRFSAAFECRARTGEFKGELNFVKKNGEVFPADVSSSIFTDSSGNIRSIVRISDISERKRVADDLNRKNIEIEQFIYTVSHDLRTPLVTVKTFLGYLGQDISTGDNDRIAKDMEFIHSAADRMEALLNELLDMAQIGRATIPHEPVTFQELAAEALDALAGQIATGKVDVSVSAANPILCGDRRRLLQIWQNLLDNALKYMGDQASPRIEVGAEQQQGETVFIVCDNGIGIAPEYHEKVFGIFEKLDRQIGGVGMGLTMVKRIVEMYGGHIRVVSEGNGTGSSFSFTLPEAVGSGGCDT